MRIRYYVLLLACVCSKLRSLLHFVFVFEFLIVPIKINKASKFNRLCSWTSGSSCVKPRNGRWIARKKKQNVCFEKCEYFSGQTCMFRHRTRAPLRIRIQNIVITERFSTIVSNFFLSHFRSIVHNTYFNSKSFKCVSVTFNCTRQSCGIRLCVLSTTWRRLVLCIFSLLLLLFI